MLAIGHDVRPAVGQARYCLNIGCPLWSSTFSGENVAMVLAPIVALGAACDAPGGRGFALGIGTVAFFVTPGWRSPTGRFLDDLLEA